MDKVITSDGLYGTLARRLAEAESTIERLQRELAKQRSINEIDRRKAERYGPCPDHSGKDRGECLMCRAEKAERERDVATAMLELRTQELAQERATLGEVIRQRDEAWDEQDSRDQ